MPAKTMLSAQALKNSAAHTAVSVSILPPLRAALSPLAVTVMMMPVKRVSLTVEMAIAWPVAAVMVSSIVRTAATSRTVPVQKPMTITA